MTVLKKFSWYRQTFEIFNNTSTGKDYKWWWMIFRQIFFAKCSVRIIHLNKNKVPVTTKIIKLRAVLYTLTYVKLNALNFCIMKAIQSKLWQLICEMYMEILHKFYIIPTAQSWVMKKVLWQFIGTTSVDIENSFCVSFKLTNETVQVIYLKIQNLFLSMHYMK